MSALDTMVGGTHYQQGGIQVVEYCEANRHFTFCQSAMIKYAYRLGSKDKIEREIKKIVHYCQLFRELNPKPILNMKDYVITPYDFMKSNPQLNQNQLGIITLASELHNEDNPHDLTYFIEKICDTVMEEECNKVN